MQIKFKIIQIKRRIFKNVSSLVYNFSIQYQFNIKKSFLPIKTQVSISVVMADAGYRRHRYIVLCSTCVHERPLRAAKAPHLDHPVTGNYDGRSSGTNYLDDFYWYTRYRHERSRDP